MQFTINLDILKEKAEVAGHFIDHLSILDRKQKEVEAKAMMPRV